MARRCVLRVMNRRETVSINRHNAWL